MAKNSDSIWSLIGGLFLGAIVGVLVTGYCKWQPFRTPSSSNQGNSEITKDTFNELGHDHEVASSAPLSEDLSESELTEARTAWKNVAAEIFGNEVNKPESKISIEAERLLKELRDASDPLGDRPSTILLAYATAAHSIGNTVSSLEILKIAWGEDQRNREIQMKVVQSELENWRRQAQEFMTEAAYNRTIAEQNRAAAEQNRIAAEQAISSANQSARAAQYSAQIAAEARTTSQAAIAAANSLRRESQIERQERIRRQLPPPLFNGIEIHNGRAYGPDGNFMNITPQGSRILIEP